MKYKNILLVNDNTDDAEIFVSVLNAINHKIKSSVEDSALEALKKLQDSKLSPDIIFLDYNMSYLDGSVFLKLLRDIKSLKKIPVVLYSQNSGVMLQDALSKFKKVKFLKKHSNFRKLFESLQKIMISEKAVKKKNNGFKIEASDEGI
ncbi:response regulator [Flavobacterium reichenbachii]|uniref:response regulator n=1 Tax=Flavobacterium reichenbachii TaxID=362418 RepID=UPI00068D8FB0|nr:response regulator [Flavobacterium reichenbachii]OXB15153.1 response regulator [Flavobacterium reichenbachii]